MLSSPYSLPYLRMVRARKWEFSSQLSSAHAYANNALFSFNDTEWKVFKSFLSAATELLEEEKKREKEEETSTQDERLYDNDYHAVKFNHT